MVSFLSPFNKALPGRAGGSHHCVGPERLQEETRSLSGPGVQAAVRSCCPHEAIWVAAGPISSATGLEKLLQIAVRLCARLPGV